MTGGAAGAQTESCNKLVCMLWEHAVAWTAAVVVLLLIKYVCLRLLDAYPGTFPEAKRHTCVFTP